MDEALLLVICLGSMFAFGGFIEHTTRPVPGQPSLADRARTRAGQAWCLLRTRHKGRLLAFEGGRVFLRCMDCGHESAGWSVMPTPRKVASGAAQ